MGRELRAPGASRVHRAVLVMCVAALVICGPAIAQRVRIIEPLKSDLAASVLQQIDGVAFTDQNDSPILLEGADGACSHA